MTDLAEHVYSDAVRALDAIPSEERADIYVVSFFVYDESDDPRKPTVTVGFSTESDVAASGDDEEEARWNYAFWRQNELAIICDSAADPAGAALREGWAREKGLWYDLAVDENPVFRRTLRVSCRTASSAGVAGSNPQLRHGLYAQGERCSPGGVAGGRRYFRRSGLTLGVP